jgi:hypothetical protein
MDFSTGYKRGFLKWTKRHWLIRSNVKLYGSGRAAFLDIARELSKMGVKRLWIPAWQCGELILSLKTVKSLELHFYEIDHDLVPTSAAVEKLHAQHDALLIVDYFASVPESALLRIFHEFKGQIILDAVHSWQLSDLSHVLPANITVISGFRKLFWKAVGAIVTNGLAVKLPAMPCISLVAAPEFPRNLSLRPRFGFLSTSVLFLLNLDRYDEIASNWAVHAERGKLFALRSPVGLVPSTTEAGGWLWPDLWRKLPAKLLDHAERLRQSNRVKLR